MKNQKQPPREPEGMTVLVGETLALVQHGLDKLCEWGFAKMQSVPRQGKERQIKNPILRMLARVGRGTVRFFGGMGKAYYERYEELKMQSKTK